MSNNKQTSSVDELWDYLKGWIPQGQYAGVREGYLEAKAMHKVEIMEAYNESFRLRDKPYSTAIKYYNETFGGNKL